LKEGSYTLGAVVGVCDEASTAALNLFYFLDISLGMRIPSAWSIINDWSYVSCVASFFDLLAASAEVPG
jgi:hypothetical protein